MKKILSLLLCVSFMFAFAACGKADKNAVKTGVISESIQFSIVDDNNKVWLTNKDFEKISVKTDKNGNNYLEFVTTQKGEKELLKTSKDNLNKTLSLLTNETLLFTITITEPIKDGILTYEGKTLDPVYAFNLLADVSNRTEGLTAPKNVISKEKAKSIALEKANVTADSVSDFEISLEFDEDWRSWEYDIEFNVGEAEYEFEINAILGTIIKFAS